MKELAVISPERTDTPSENKKVIENGTLLLLVERDISTNREYVVAIIRHPERFAM